MSVARIYRTSSPYTGADLLDIDSEQSADTMYIAQINHPPTKLVRTAHINWTFSTIPFAPVLIAPVQAAAVVTRPNVDDANSGASYYPKDAKYQVTALDDNTGQESRPSNIITANNDLNLVRNYNTLSWAAVTGASRYYVYKGEITGDFGYIGSTDALTFRDDNIGPDYSDGPTQGETPFPTSSDYPSTVAFYQQRLGWARTANHPNAVYFSRSGEYENMDISRPLKASDALSFALVAGRVNAVNQLVSTNALLALTSDSVFSINGGQDGYLSPTNIVTKRQNGRGSSRLGPLVIDNVAFYQESIGNSIRTLGYEFSIDGYNSSDITIFSPHFFRGFNITSWAYVAEPLSIIWAVRNDGKLLAFTWQQEQEVWGWTLCDTDGTVESVCAISEQGEDRLYLTVRRKINNISRLFIERMATAKWLVLDDSCYMDAAVSHRFTVASTVLTNLGHLEGKTVVALADGTVVPDLVVVNGTVTLPVAAKNIRVGLPYTATVETLPLASQTPQGGWTIAKPQELTKAVVKVNRSRGFLVGASGTKLDEPRPRSNEPYGSPPNLITGLVEVALRPRIGKSVSLVIQSTQPLPLEINEVLLDPSVSQ